MSRARSRKNEVTATLFPFLAVLLSTMGVLVVLLVAMASVQADQAKNKQATEAEARRQAANTPAQRKLRKELSRHESLLVQLSSARDDAHEALRDALLRTTQIEENIRRWQDQLGSLRLAISELLQLDGEHTDDRQQAELRLADLQRQIAGAQDQIAELEDEVADRPKAYAILPYDGPNGTRRRPIYIECLKDRVVIQPEGIELFAEDFHPELGAGNPLAAALRAASDYYRKDNGDRNDEPYPLVIVRPDGIGSYRAVLGAISSWDSPFGYEMVGDDWQLELGAANPEITLEIAKAVENARERQAHLAKAAPAAFASRAQNAFEVSPGLLELVRSRAPLGDGFSSGGASGESFGRSGSSAGRESPRPNDRIAAALSSAVGAGGGEQKVGSDAPAAREQSEGQVASGQGAATMDGETMDGKTAPDSQTGGHAGLYPSESSQGESQEQAQSLASGTEGSGGGNSPPSAMANSGQASQPGGESGQGPTTVNVSQANSGGGGSSSTARRSDKSPRNGLGVQRPIQVVVRPDRLIVLHDSVRPTAQSASGRTVLLDRTDGEASQRFSAAIRKHIEDWGIAGSGSYWKPVLVLNVAPGGEKLAKELSTALRASGVEVRLPNSTRR